MLPDDPRHGTYAGAMAHWVDDERPCGSCETAEWRYRKMRQLRHLRGERVTVSAVGIVRRYRALLAMGHTGPQIAEAAGVSINTLRGLGYKANANALATTAAGMERAFESLCMTRPEGQYATRARRMAQRRGYLPPLAWVDIDDPSETPDLSVVDTSVDEVVVHRILTGNWTLRATKSERWEVIERWSGSDNELERRTGWNVARDRREMRAVFGDDRGAA